MPATTPNPGPYDLGPFQELKAIQWGAGVGGDVIGVFDLPNFLAYLQPCAIFLFNAGAPPDAFQQTEFNFDAGYAPPDDDTILNGTFTGVTSGATYQPASHYAQSPLDLYCTAVDHRIYAPEDRAPVDGRLTGAHLAFLDDSGALGRWTVFAYLNYGRFLVPKLNFIQGERFTFTP